jgi:effector-binding domain-containing protein
MKFYKKGVVFFSILVGVFLVWYLFIKKSDYCISFKVKTASGTVFQGINEWAALRQSTKNESYRIIEIENFSFIKQSMTKDKINLEYIWEINAVNDSITEVKACIKDVNNSIYNRLTVPFFETDFRKNQIEKITDFRNGLNKHLESFKVKIEGVGISQETVVAYISLKSVMQEKARAMIANDAIITGYLQRNNIKITGKPFAEIQNWDLDKETLDFNYCFPIAPDTRFIENDLVKFKTIKAVKGLKATYYGNFRTSDRAWFALLDYAKRQGYDLVYQPLEHFLANPFNGGDESTWETKIIIPIKEK